MDIILPSASAIFVNDICAPYFMDYLLYVAHCPHLRKPNPEFKGIVS
jgi:hypothetical protein